MNCNTKKDFFTQLKLVLDQLENLSEMPEWGKYSQVALDDGEMTLGDALQAVGWLVERGTEHD